MSPIPSYYVGTQFVLCNLTLAANPHVGQPASGPRLQSVPNGNPLYHQQQGPLYPHPPYGGGQAVKEPHHGGQGPHSQQNPYPWLMPSFHLTPWRVFPLQVAANHSAGILTNQNQSVTREPAKSDGQSHPNYLSCFPSGFYRDGNQVRWLDQKTGRWYFHSFSGMDHLNTETFVVVVLIVGLWFYSIYRMWMVWAYTLNFDQSMTTAKGWDFVVQWLAHRINTKKRAQRRDTVSGATEARGGGSEDGGEDEASEAQSSTEFGRKERSRSIGKSIKFKFKRQNSTPTTVRERQVLGSRPVLFPGPCPAITQRNNSLIKEDEERRLSIASRQRKLTRWDTLDEDHIRLLRLIHNSHHPNRHGVSQIFKPGLSHSSSGLAGLTSRRHSLMSSSQLMMKSAHSYADCSISHSNVHPNNNNSSSLTSPLLSPEAQFRRHLFQQKLVAVAAQASASSSTTSQSGLLARSLLSGSGSGRGAGLRAGSLSFDGVTLPPAAFASAAQHGGDKQSRLSGSGLVNLPAVRPQAVSLSGSQTASLPLTSGKQADLTGRDDVASSASTIQSLPFSWPVQPASSMDNNHETPSQPVNCSTPLQPASVAHSTGSKDAEGGNSKSDQTTQFVNEVTQLSIRPDHVTSPVSPGSETAAKDQSENPLSKQRKMRESFRRMKCIQMDDFAPMDNPTFGRQSQASSTENPSAEAKLTHEDERRISHASEEGTPSPPSIRGKEQKSGKNKRKKSKIRNNVLMSDV